jgi:hypothetical protein
MFRLPANISYPNLALTRGVAQAESGLVGWCQATLDSGLGKPITTQNLSLSLSLSLLDEESAGARHRANRAATGRARVRTCLSPAVA